MQDDKDKLKFSGKRHDSKIESFEQEKARVKVTAIIDRHWTRWKKAVKKSKGMKRSELVQSLYNLRDAVIKESEGEKSLADWRSMTHSIIDDVIARTINDKAESKNSITEFIPLEDNESTIIWTADKKKRQPKSFDFRSPQELFGIPFVKEAMEKTYTLNDESTAKFCGFVLKNNNGLWLIANYSNGMAIPVGRCLNLVGLMAFPTQEQMEAELNKPENN